ncbi:MAG TPA: tetratricopeptide repeat protein, partial [Polyangiaceae bacterium]
AALAALGARTPAALAQAEGGDKADATGQTPNATTPGATSGDPKAAGAAFMEGQRAYKKGDYRHAADSFEKAYQLYPKLPALWNAARAWQDAGELTRAANLYSKYLSLAPPSAPDRDRAIKALNQLNEKLARADVHARDFQNVQLDGAAIEGLENAPDHTLVVYVNPGEHVVTGTKDGTSAKNTASIAPGAIVSMVLSLDEKAPPPPPPPTPVVVDDRFHGLPPWVLLIGGGLTAVSLGVTIWSGLDTNSARSDFDASPTQQKLDDGRGKETRTNVLIGVTAGVAVLTGVTAAFLVDWKGKGKETKPPADGNVTVGFGPGSFAVKGAF